MRIRIFHETVYRYNTPAKSAIEILRLTPRNHEGQYIVRWRLELNVDCRLDPFEDAFGNLAHSFSVDGPLSELVVRVEGEVETQDTAGIINGTMERFPPSLYLRETPLTAPDAAIAAFARETMSAAAADPLATLHALTARIYDEFAFDPGPTHSATSAAEAFALKRGVCQDYAQIFIASARYLGIPARYVSGYFLRVDGVTAQDAGHAWAEAYWPALGWIAFDPANGISTTAAHVRVAIGLDSLAAAPVRGMRFGGEGEELSVAIHVDQAGRQAQN
jgi:transglutaminase-like putative cysteine protease